MTISYRELWKEREKMKTIKFSASLSYMFPTLIFHSRFVYDINEQQWKILKKIMLLNLWEKMFLFKKGIEVTSYLILFKIDSDVCEYDKNVRIKIFI